MVKKLEPGPVVGPIERGFPMPRSKNNAGLRKRMEELRDSKYHDASFVTGASRSGVYAMSKKLKLRVNVRQETESTIRVWKIVDDEADR